MIFQWSNKWNISNSTALTPRPHFLYLWHQAGLSVCLSSVYRSHCLILTSGWVGVCIFSILTATLYRANFSKSAVFIIDMLHKTIKETTNCFYLVELYFAEYIRKSKIWDILQDQQLDFFNR